MTDQHLIDKEEGISKEEPLLVLPIPGLLIKTALPVIIGLLISGIHNFVDAIFISRAVGVHGIGGVTAVFPLQLLIVSISAMLGAGMASIVSRHLGAKQQIEASKVFSSSLLFAVILGALLTIVLLVGRDVIFHLLQFPEQLVPYAKEYYGPVLGMSVLVFVLTMLTDGFRAEGKMQQVMLIMMVSSMSNIGLDALFLFVFGWGVTGAAWATVLAVSISLALAINILRSRDHQIKVSLPDLKLNRELQLKTMLVGLPVLLSYAGTAFTIAVVNYFLAKLSASNADLLISANGILQRTFMLLLFPILGLMIAFQTLAGYNFGARQYERLTTALTSAVVISTIYCVLCASLMIFTPQIMLSLFTSDAALLSAASEISSVIFIGFIAAGAVMMSVGVFQSMGKVGQAIVFNALHGFILLIPGLLIFTNIWGVEGVWWTFPIIEFTAFLVIITYTFFYFKTILLEKNEFTHS